MVSGGAHSSSCSASSSLSLLSICKQKKGRKRAHGHNPRDFQDGQNCGYLENFRSWIGVKLGEST